VKNRETRVSITKYDAQMETQLGGVRLRLEDLAGNVIDSWETDGSPHILRNTLNAGEEYTLIEVAPHAGFALAAPVTFLVPQRPNAATTGITMDGNGNPVYHVRMDNQRIYQFLKVDADDDTPLAGAKLYIRDAGGATIVPEWTSTGSPHEVNGILVPGQTYWIVEGEPPADYDAADADLAFTVGTDGTLTVVKIPNTRSATLPLAVTPTPTPTPTPAPYVPPLPATAPPTPYIPPPRQPTDEPTPTPTPTPSPAPTPFATPTQPIGGGVSVRQPLGMRLVDGEFVFLDDLGIPLAAIPGTGDDSEWLLWIGAAIVPLIGIGIAIGDIGKKRKRRAQGRGRVG